MGVLFSMLTITCGLVLAGICTVKGGTGVLPNFRWLMKEDHLHPVSNVRREGVDFVSQALPKEEFPDGVRGKSSTGLVFQLLADTANELITLCSSRGVVPLSPLVWWLSQCQAGHGPGHLPCPAGPKLSEPASNRGSIYSGALNVICSCERCMERWLFRYQTLVAVGDSLHSIITPCSNKSVLIALKWRMAGFVTYPEKSITLVIHQRFITFRIFTRRAGVPPHTVLSRLFDKPASRWACINCQARCWAQSSCLHLIHATELN